MKLEEGGAVVAFTSQGWITNQPWPVTTRIRIFRTLGVLMLLRLTMLIFVALPLIAQTRDAEQEVRRLNVEEVNAFLHKDAAAMARLWSDDFHVTNPLNKFVTKQDVLNMMRSGMLIITSYDRQIEYLRVYGDTVFVAGPETVVWGGRMPNAGKTEHLRFTAVWMKQNGRFQEVLRHANIVPEK